MNKAIIAVALVLVIVIIAIYALTGFKFLGSNKVTTTIYQSVSTSIENTTLATTTINPSSECSNFTISGNSLNSTYNSTCSSFGGTLGLWVAAGYSGSESVQIVGADGITYVNQTSSYNCTTFYQNFTAPQQLYTVTLKTGTGGGSESCGSPFAIINSTTTPPQSIYNYIYNGDFSNGEYTGWNVTNPGFGASPLNISYSDSKLCYPGRPWSNYIGSYFATTYNCGISVAPGNLTSEPFRQNPNMPFVNFRLISPQDNDLYFEILRVNYKVVNGMQVYVNSTPVAVMHFNTYNLSVTSYSSSTFANATIPLTLYTNQVLQLRIVAKTQVGSNLIAAGDFVLSNRPHQDKTVTANFTSISN